MATTTSDLARIMAQLGHAAAACRTTLAQSSGQQRNCGAGCRSRAGFALQRAVILAANARDMEAARARKPQRRAARSAAAE